MPHDPAVVSAQPLAPARAHARPPSRFAHHSSVLQALVGDVLQYAKMLGASDCEVEVSEGFGQAITVRCGDVENICSAIRASKFGAPIIRKLNTLFIGLFGTQLHRKAKCIVQRK